ncbi:MAG: hypothetical protein U5K51_10940 [Flavobacteriaceae bacterium]|nr:hypothetical protein [Flavobacteriaceae bacterium]
MKHCILIIALLIYSQSFSQNEAQDKEAILNVLSEQKAAWNKNDIEGFMAGYWI